MIYCDLDGVLVDLVGKLSEIYGFKLNNGETFIDYFNNYIDKLTSKEKIDFWANLPETKDCQILWNYIKKYKPYILTSCSESMEACDGKNIWCQNHIGVSGKRIICVEKSKVKKYYASAGKILIDDLHINIQEWRDWGGNGILHVNAESTIKALTSIR
jgi:5'(3')-deoxyribonucleotidase